ncbi:MAG: ISKra4 family transposase [Gammaproteobacteria bacterium]|nr:ISKra4 family transposase [Gammaproteobacteria bacterium]
MQKAYTKVEPTTFDEFTATRDQLERVISRLRSPEASNQRHDELESMIHQEGQELCRLLYQAGLDVRSNEEVKREAVTGHDNVVRTYYREGCERQIESMFGEVIYRRKGYSHPQGKCLFPLDEALNMPKRKYTYGLRACISLAVCQNAFDASLEGLSTLIEGKIPKRQAQELVSEVSTDFEAFYAQRAITPVQVPGTVLVMSQDGKGIALRHEDLREATRKAAQQEHHTLCTRLSTGEKRNRKRMATVATVYDVAPHVRSAVDVIGRQGEDGKPSRKDAPKAQNKRVWASIEADMERVTEQIVEESLRRDPKRERPWVMLVDGHKDQIKVIKRVFKRHAIKVPLILDFIHVLEYLWRATWCFFDSKDKEQAQAAEHWVLEKAQAILEGRSGPVAAGIRIKAKRCALSAKKQEVIATVANYLTNHTAMLRYDQFMQQGYPIATGVIEGACRHLIADRFEITGARWSLKTAEGILRLRAIRASGDWDRYQAFHKKQEWKRNHLQRFHGPETQAMVWAE